MKRRICSQSGCFALVDETEGHCKRHAWAQAEKDAKAKEAGAKQWDKLHDRQAKTGQQSLYRSAEWRKLRKLALMLNPYCPRCGEKATDVHHIKPANGDAALFFDQGNVIALCRRCHHLAGLEESKKARGVR